MDEQEQAGLERVTLLVRTASAAGRLVRWSEAAEAFMPEGPLETAAHRLAELLPAAGCLRVLGEGENACLYAETEMTESYARLVHRTLLSDTVALVAETVSEESRLFSRPTAVDLFVAPPFSLAREALEAALDRLAGDPRYPEIDQVTASDGQRYLYSRRYLLPELAASLAEWYAVGQFASP